MEKIFIAKINHLNWLDKESFEAEVLFEINGNKLWAFCHPCNFIEGEITKVCFSLIEEDISEYVFWNENTEKKRELVSSKNDVLKYYCYGFLKSIHPTIVDCGVMDISLGDYINDENAIGNYVYFVISRLDISKCL